MISQFIVAVNQQGRDYLSHWLYRSQFIKFWIKSLVKQMNEGIFHN